jgi:hypothetical protein
MKYSFTCKADGEVLSVEAKDDKEALRKLMVLGKKHVKDAHRGASPMTATEWQKFLRAEWKKQK